MVKEVAGKIRTIDFSKIPGVVDIMDDSMIGTEARRQFDDAIDVIAQNMADTVDAEIIEELKNMKPTIEDFKDWLVALGVAPKFLEKVHSEDIAGGSRTLCLLLHMNDACYRVNVVYCEEDDGWMECSSIPGNFVTSSPVTSGPFTLHTWNEMSVSMGGHKLIRVTQPKYCYG